jgi:hypothetical protein
MIQLKHFTVLDYHDSSHQAQLPSLVNGTKDAGSPKQELSRHENQVA